jgi:predicted Fe-S protein YdhL (DUF1289 family)
MSPVSPCNKICQIHPERGWCIGCGRTLAEIAAWGGASDVDRVLIVSAAARRVERLAREGSTARS